MRYWVKWPHSAVKCNPDVHLLQSLKHMGVKFDCASLEEMQLILRLGIDPSRGIFAHPCKSVSQHGIGSTSNNLDELDKVKAHYPDMGLLLRIFAQDDGAKVNLGDKSGAPCNASDGLLEKAKPLRLNILGVGFHIGMWSSVFEPLLLALV